MATQDDFSQGVSIAALTDPPDAASLARGIANAIAGRSIMRFASATDRTAKLVGAAAPVEGMISWLQDIDELHIYQGGAWQQLPYGSNSWVDWAPTWSGLTNNGASTSTGRYRKIGKTVDLIGCLVWGAGSSLGTGNVTVSLPFNASSAPVAAGGWQGTGRYNDGVAAYRGMLGFLNSGGSSFILQTQRTSDLAYTTPGSVGLGWASGASMRFQITYEAA